MLPHMQALLQTDRRLPAESEISLAEVTAEMSRALGWAGLAAATLAVAESGLARDHGLTENHSAVLWLRMRRASATRMLGRYAEAEAELRQVLDTGLRVVGPDDLLTLITRQEIARALADQGRTAAAETEFRQALDAHMRVVGPDNPSTLATRHDIARMLAAQGRTVDAETEFRQVLGAELRALEPTTPRPWPPGTRSPEC